MTLEFTAPAPGQWALDRSHFPGGVTPISQWFITEGMQKGLARVFAELGMPAETMDVKFVNGFMYTRLRSLVGGDRAVTKAPPAFLLGLVARLHPEFRARNKRAIATLRDRPSNEVVAEWENEIRPRLVKTNTDFQQFDVTNANDVELQSHITALLDQLRDSCELHFWLHGHDLGPIARYLHDALRWDLDPNQAIAALAGASPSTAKPAETLVKLRAMLDASPNPIHSLDDLRNISGEARHLLAKYLDTRGHILATGYDLTSRTLIEMPDVVLRSIRAAEPPPQHHADGIAGELRNRVPASDRAEFTMRLEDARNIMDMRDDNGPLTIEWPVGLLRRAMLEAGRRLVERSTIASHDHVFTLTHLEARKMFVGTLPSAEVLSDRAERHQLESRLDAPITLGPDEVEPDLSALPTALAELIAMTQVAIDYIGMGGKSPHDKLAGAGIGDVRYVGTARVATSADEAFDHLEPGDVLIVRATSPAFNAVLAIAGAVVTSDGGVLSHAAVLSRELGIPAVIGAAGALSIQDGCTVEVDPVAGMVRVVSSISA